MTKNELRNLYKEKRKTLTQNEADELSMAIANTSLSAPIWNLHTYHIFLPIARQLEVDTSYLLTILQGKDKEVVLSRSDFETGNMKHFLLTDSTVIKTNKIGIPEPQSGIEVQPEILDVVFIPLLAYDHQGNRVGYGKGFYDRFLTHCKENTLKIGISFFSPAEAIEDIDQNDIPLDLCITPETYYDFRS